MVRSCKNRFLFFSKPSFGIGSILVSLGLILFGLSARIIQHSFLVMVFPTNKVYLRDHLPTYIFRYLLICVLRRSLA